MFLHLLPSARAVLEDAQTQARRLGQPEVRTEHVLLALATSVQASIASHILTTNGLTPERIRSALDATVVVDSGSGPVTQQDAEALRMLGIDVAEVLRRLEDSFGPEAFVLSSPSRPKFLGGGLPFSSDAKQALIAAVREARRQHHNHLTAEHLLLGILSARRGPAVELLSVFDTTAEALKAQVLAASRRAS